VTVVIFITAKEDEAEKIAFEVVSKRLAACVNIVPSVSSIYWWQGKVERDKESLLVVKSEEEVLDRLIKTVKRIHSYSVPEIIAVKVVGGLEDYLQWVKETCVGSGE